MKLKYKEENIFEDIKEELLYRPIKIEIQDIYVVHENSIEKIFSCECRFRAFFIINWTNYIIDSINSRYLSLVYDKELLEEFSELKQKFINELNEKLDKLKLNKLKVDLEEKLDNTFSGRHEIKEIEYKLEIKENAGFLVPALSCEFLAIRS